MAYKIRIAIFGSGVAGASLMRALMQYDHLDVHLFDKATSFQENEDFTGHTVLLSALATAALDLMFTTSCLQGLDVAPMNRLVITRAHGRDIGSEVHIPISAMFKDTKCIIVERADLVRRLLAEVPRSKLHTSRQLKAYDHLKNDTVLCYFDDGSVEDYNVCAFPMSMMISLTISD